MAICAIADLDFFCGALIFGGVVPAVGYLAVHAGINRFHHLFSHSFPKHSMTSILRIIQSIRR